MVPASVFVLILPLLVVGIRTSGQSPVQQIDQPNSQNSAILSVAGLPHMTRGIGGGDISTDHGALVPYTGPHGVAADQVYVPSSEEISLYVVRDGDTLGHIAELFDVSTNTIRWANEIGSKDTIQPGQVLTILPISSVRHVVESGETLASVVEQYDGDMYETALYNGIEEDARLAVGDIVLIPDGVADVAESPSSSSQNKKSEKPSSAPKSTTPSSRDTSYFVRAWGGVRSQGFHGRWRALDFALPVGSNIGASASGTVIAAKSPYAWNGGYGGMVVLKHDNGAQTLYAHLSELKVAVGQQVQQGQVIGLSGNTGRSTGPHLHFEIRNWGDIPF
jgi:murein DD-endopeptidase MepM/ murein hydrolase activator NlpD